MAGKSDQDAYKGDRKRLSNDQDEAPLKRAKKEEAEESKVKMEKYNPYLAHLDQGDESKNGFDGGNGLPKGSPLYDFQRRATTAKQAAKAEAGDYNPFTGEPHSQKYFAILETRKNLPVQKQR